MDQLEVISEIISQDISVESDDVAARKQARQIRIRSRHEYVLKKEKFQESADGFGERGSGLDKTINDSNEKLFQISVDGKELVTNIRVASDAREIERRQEELVARNARLQKLEDEASLALEKLKAISAKWDNIVISNDPLDLHQELREQKSRCMELIEQKNNLIKDFKNELKLSDERFMNDREAMFEDISMLAKRIDEQVLVIKSNYLAELTNIEAAIDKARRDILNQNQIDWEKLHEKRETDEVTNMKKKFELMNTTDEEVRQVFIKHDENFRDTKIRLESEVQVLEQELDQIKALCLINSEKLDYNYQVLKKREVENVLIKSQQKRTLNKLQEEVMVLRKKIDEKETAAQKELARLDKELNAYRKNVIDIEKKADHFSEINNRKFQKIWDMKTEEATDLLNKILTADKIIHEQVLGIDWFEPPVKPLKKDDLVSYQAAVAVVNEVLCQPDEAAGIEAGEAHAPNKKLLKHILSLIADNAGFLIEEKLDELLEPYSEAERTLVRVDNVFNAIGVRRSDEIQLLQVYFLPFAVCGICSRDEKTTEVALRSEETKPMKDTVDFLCKNQHPLQIEKIFVIKGLRDYVAKLHSAKFRARAQTEVRLAKHRCTISRLLSNEDIDLYWSRFKEIFLEDDEAVWDALFDGLTKYHALLQERAKLSIKTEKLKRQNAELTRLVARYLPQQSWRLPQLNPQGTPSSSTDIMDIVNKATR